MRFLLMAAIALFIFSGCSAKEFNEGVDSISSDISNAFEGAKDNSAD